MKATDESVAPGDTAQEEENPAAKHLALNPSGRRSMHRALDRGRNLH